MKLSSYLILPLFLSLLWHNPPITIENAYNEGDYYWISGYIMSFIGRYHDFPKSGQDILNYYDAGEIIIKNDSTFVNQSHITYPSRKLLKQVFCSNKCIYGSSLCVVPYKKERHIVSKKLTEWQDNKYDYYWIYYKPAFFDKGGSYMFLTSGQLQDSFAEGLRNYCNNNHHSLIVYYSFVFDNFGAENKFNRPLMVRVRYKDGEDVILAEKGVLPDSVFLVSRFTDENCSISIGELDCFLSLNDALNIYKPFFQSFINDHNDINEIDCLVPIMLNIK